MPCHAAHHVGPTRLLERGIADAVDQVREVVMAQGFGHVGASVMSGPRSCWGVGHVASVTSGGRSCRGFVPARASVTLALRFMSAGPHLKIDNKIRFTAFHEPWLVQLYRIN